MSDMQSPSMVSMLPHKRSAKAYNAARSLGARATTRVAPTCQADRSLFTRQPYLWVRLLHASGVFLSVLHCYRPDATFTLRIVQNVSPPVQSSVTCVCLLRSLEGLIGTALMLLLRFIAQSSKLRLFLWLQPMMQNLSSLLKQPIAMSI